MVQEIIVRYQIDEILRQAEKERLITIAQKCRKEPSNQILNTFLYRFGLIADC